MRDSSPGPVITRDGQSRSELCNEEQHHDSCAIHPEVNVRRGRPVRGLRTDGLFPTGVRTRPQPHNPHSRPFERTHPRGPRRDYPPVRCKQSGRLNRPRSNLCCYSARATGGTVVNTTLQIVNGLTGAVLAEKRVWLPSLGSTFEPPDRCLTFTAPATFSLATNLFVVRVAVTRDRCLPASARPIPSRCPCSYTHRTPAEIRPASARSASSRRIPASFLVERAASAPLVRSSRPQMG